MFTPRETTITYEIGPRLEGLIRFFGRLFDMGKRFDDLDASLAELGRKQAEAAAQQQQTQQHVLEIVKGLHDQVDTLQATIADLNQQLAEGGLSADEAAQLQAKIAGATTATEALIQGIKAIDPTDPTTLPTPEPPAS